MENFYYEDDTYDYDEYDHDYDYDSSNESYWDYSYQSIVSEIE